ILLMVFLSAAAASAAPPPAPAKVEWTAQWIWEANKGQGQGGPPSFQSPAYQNLFTYFRKTFDLPSGPVAAVTHVSADSRYRLYVNGRYVGRGPVRGDLVWQYYDDYDITPFLHSGKNVIAALVHYYGE